MYIYIYTCNLVTNGGLVHAICNYASLLTRYDISYNIYTNN